MSAVEPTEREAAKARQGTRTDLHPDKLSESSKSRAREKVGAFAGVSGKQIEKIKAIMDAAKERQGGPGRDRSDKLPERSGAQTREKVGAFAGVSGAQTLGKVCLMLTERSW